MSHSLTARNPDLARLVEEGYAVEIRDGFLLLHQVPYVTAQREVRRGTLVAPLRLAHDQVLPPDDHTIYFVGGYPCDQYGTELGAIRNSDQPQPLLPDLTADRRFSARPGDLPGGRYPDFYAKCTRYLAILSAPAAALDPNATARIGGVVAPRTDASVFRYIDTASARAGIASLVARLADERLGIIGVGGTGTYVLDFVAKTPVRAIHLFDGDGLESHNAFRAPGAVPADVLRARPTKVAYYAALYEAMHTGIVAHDAPIDATNVDALRALTFVFVCIDDGPAKRLIVDTLRAVEIPFVDVGMGLYQGDAQQGGALGGALRTTLCTPAYHGHLEQRVSFGGDDPDAIYAQNIQIAELNAMNAAFAVVRWKQLRGFYADLRRAHHSVYTVETNALANADEG